MSRYYSMGVTVDGYQPQRADAILDAMQGIWEFEGGEMEWGVGGKKLCASGDGKLYGGESEAEFADRLAAVVWATNGASCEVVVDATYLEDLPCETYTKDESDYIEWLKAKEVK